jgi:hypothetical protein
MVTFIFTIASLRTVLPRSSLEQSYRGARGALKSYKNSRFLCQPSDDHFNKLWKQFGNSGPSIHIRIESDYLDFDTVDSLVGC